MCPAWNVGALFAHDQMLLQLHNACVAKGLPQPVQTVYGGIPCAWHGGRIAPYTCEPEQAELLIREYNSRGIGCNLTMSAPDVCAKDLQDKRSNILLDILAQGQGNGVIMASELLADYVGQKYPNLKRISSVLRPTFERQDYNDNPDYYNQLCERFDLVVLRPEWVFDLDFLNALERKDKIEIMANQVCCFFCTHAVNHYSVQMRVDRDNSDYEAVALEQALERHCASIRLKQATNTLLLDKDYLHELMALGFRQFKLVGRTAGAKCFAKEVQEFLMDIQ